MLVFHRYPELNLLSLPYSYFEIDGFNAPFKFDRDINGDGIMIFVGEDITVNLLTIKQLHYQQKAFIWS